MKKYKKFNAENIKLIKRKNIIKKIISKRLKKVKLGLNHQIKNNPSSKWFKILFILYLLLLLLVLYFNVFDIKKKLNSRKLNYSKYEKKFNNNSTCDLMDPIYIFNLRLKNKPIEICNSQKTKHICYTNNNGEENFLEFKNGIICTMENIIIDPSKSRQTGFIYKGPVDKKKYGLPRLSKGFFNTKCEINNNIEFKYNKFYETYLNAWEYDYNVENEKERLEELAPGKTVFFISRNQDSPNLFHGNCEIINVISMLYLFNLSPEEIQVVFMESIEIEISKDPFYDIYKNIISLGGPPIYLKNLQKKYKISKAIHVPIIWDSPPFTFIESPKCNYITKTYQLYNDLIDIYMNLIPFKDTFVSDNETIYYPNLTLKNFFEKKIKFKKRITIQWRKVWPPGRTGQRRLLYNGQKLADKLSEELPSNILVRLVNTAKLNIKEQIELTRNTDYFIGVHGAGLALAIFLPKKSIVNEILKSKKNNLLSTMAWMSGHVTYSDIIKAQGLNIDGNKYYNFDENDFTQKVIKHMKENNFFD